MPFSHELQLFGLKICIELLDCVKGTRVTDFTPEEQEKKNMPQLKYAPEHLRSTAVTFEVQIEHKF